MSGDGAKRDSDGYIWITGRIDDMLNCSGTIVKKVVDLLIDQYIRRYTCWTQK